MRYIQRLNKNKYNEIYTKAKQMRYIHIYKYNEIYKG